MDLDVIELKRRIYESEERFSLVMESSGAGYWDWDLLTDQFSPSGSSTERRIAGESVGAVVGGNRYLSVGFATAFLISGPVTTLPAMTAVFGIAVNRVFVLYLLIALIGAVLFGTLFSFLAVV